MITADEKKKRGTYKRTRAKKQVLKTTEQIPKPFFKLDKDGRAFYNHICKELIKNKRLSEVYIPDITRASWMWQIAMECVRYIEENGIMQTTKAGWNQVDSAINASSKLFDYIQKGFYSKYGLTPIDQGKLPAIEEDEEDWNI